MASVAPAPEAHPAHDPNIPIGLQQHNPHASASQWRHQESTAFARAAVAHDARAPNGDDHAQEPPTNSPDNFKPVTIGSENGATANGTAHVSDGKEIICGPLINYRHMDGHAWYGSVLVVTQGGGKTQSFQPVLSLGRIDIASGQEGLVPDQAAATSAAEDPAQIRSDHGVKVEGICLYSDPRATFWSFPIACDMADVETKWAYSIADVHYKSSSQAATNFFFVPAINESMRIMFHSCNGFSVGTDEDAWSGAALWNDVLRSHARAPFHVMIGGGDQIYNDGIRVNGPLREWTDISNPKKRRDFPFPESLREACDNYYLNNYLRWYATEPFAQANGQIPQLNIWDDHDIIDGFGSYVNDFMMCDVFRGIGGVAHKYYMLFQHHMAPPPSTYTTDAPQTVTGSHQGVDKEQLKDTFIGKQNVWDPSYIVGTRAGPYVAEHSMNMFNKLGARIAMIGIDARTERTRHQVNYPETYDLIFNRLRDELIKAADAGNPYRHLIVLLGIPIAYPRLTWLENVFSSPLIAPVKFLNRRFGFGGSAFNKFDGSIDLLDDLDDHYTARTHKKERNALLHRLQGVCEAHNIRATILGGDVHLAAFGRFYSNPDLNIPVEEDHRYMVNVVSSAIVNKPPPSAVANLLASRNKIHHLDRNTDETLLDLFDKDPGDSNKTKSSNHCTMPSRNYAIITENSPNNQPASTNGAATNGANGVNGVNGAPDANHTNGVDGAAATNPFKGRDGHSFLHKGEDSAGTKHKAAQFETHGKSNDGSLDCCIRVEIDQHDRDGKTEAYGVTIPALNYEAGKYSAHERHMPHLHRHRSRPETKASGAPSTIPASTRPASTRTAPAH
ncbi:uncharacterized protein B0I36DRAFT_343596 [Microdochium trichocladiopsis]|uniref:PhoD-like phosphatase domain-containing protein n=1 Tax=Microdochium trichocladiopsis TaxID=1682393 RepID=A0A9P8YIP7_9PEZI|nr:uncharacterized protein B0I36DRAFT_343596 [Microdochium trichocladiopsis]KAH7039744.1 hypothetical protein B0I36DRAFT_343596 [Microdochium trichocladiopsis]